MGFREGGDGIGFRFEDKNRDSEAFNVRKGLGTSYLSEYMTCEVSALSSLAAKMGYTKDSQWPAVPKRA